MEKRSMSLMFIDRVTYSDFHEDFFNNKNIVTILYKDFPDVSLLTKASIVNLNRELNKLLYFSSLTESYYNYLPALSPQERQYVSDSFKANFCGKTYPDPYYPLTDKKYYETVILPDGTLLIVVEEGFLTFITESKDNLLKLILDCLCYQYKFNLSSYLLKTYISLKLNDTYFSLIKSRFN